jgi:hypothetical protein
MPKALNVDFFKPKFIRFMRMTSKFKFIGIQTTHSEIFFPEHFLDDPLIWKPINGACIHTPAQHAIVDNHFWLERYKYLQRQCKISLSPRADSSEQFLAMSFARISYFYYSAHRRK